MAIAQIDKWLHGTRDWEHGVQLYALYGDSEILKKLFSLRPTNYSTKKLLQELTALNAAEDVRTPLPDSLPKDIQELNKQALDLYKDMAYLHANLENEKMNPTDEVRLQNALKILELQRACGDRWAVVDHYRATGARLEKELIADDADALADLQKLGKDKLVRRELTVKTYISKIQKQLKENLPEKQLRKTTVRLEKFERELQEINRLLQ